MILLSVKDHQHIDSAIPGRYTVQAPYKAGAGIGVPELIRRYMTRQRLFYRPHLLTPNYGGLDGAPKDAPVSDNPVTPTRSVHHQRNWRFRWWKYFTIGGCHHGYCPSPHSSE